MGTCPALGSSKVLQPSENAKLKIGKAEVALEKDDTTTILREAVTLGTSLPYRVTFVSDSSTVERLNYEFESWKHREV